MTVKTRWTRANPAIELDAGAIAKLLAPIFPDAAIDSFAPVPGGLTNTNVKVVLSGRSTALLLRLYQRDPAVARKEVAITARIAGSVPVPRFLYFSEHDPVADRPYAVAEWIEGEPLDMIASSLGPRTLPRLGRSIGHTLAAIHAHTFDRSGFFADDLGIPEPIDMGRAGLVLYLSKRLVEGPGGARLGPDLTDELLAFAQRDGELLDAWLDPSTLVHGDFNGPNILVRPDPDGGLEVAAVVDWEYALSASPALDFGNLLRPPFGHDRDLVAAVADGYRKAGGELPAEWQRAARVADLFAWADILGRPTIGAEVIADARAIVRDIISPDELC